MNVEFDFSTSEDGIVASTSAESVFDFLAQRKAPIGLLTIKNAIVDRRFLQKWRKATDGFRTAVIHVTFEHCHFGDLPPTEVCNFLFRYIRAISMKIEGRVESFFSTLLSDDRISRLHNLRVYSKAKIPVDDELLLARLFKPGELQVLDFRRVQLSPEFVNKLIHRFRESTRAVRCISRLFLGGDIPWPLHQLNFSKEQIHSGDRDKYRFKNRFGYFSLIVDYGKNELELQINETF